MPMAAAALPGATGGGLAREGAGGIAGEAGESQAWDGHRWSAGARRLLLSQRRKHKHPWDCVAVRLPPPRRCPL